VWLATVFLGLVLANALVYARVRAETGAPMIWFYPFYQPKDALLNLLGSGPLTVPGGFRNLVALTAWTHLAVSYQPEAMAWQMESFKLADRAAIRRKAMTVTMLLGLIVGFVTSVYALLVVYYKYGANVCPHLSNLTGWWLNLPRWAANPAPPHTPRAVATGAGALLTAALLLLRRHFLRFPLHPLGYAIAATHGDPIWAPFLGAWLAKTAILKLGGARRYQKFVPLFLGLMVGHFFMAGIVWGLWSLLRGSTPGGYIVYFG
jgi:hypothetical protein